MEQLDQAIKEITSPNVNSWIKLVNDLKEKYTYHAELDIFIRNLSKALKLKEGEFLKEATEALDQDGKKIYPNAEMRERRNRGLETFK